MRRMTLIVSIIFVLTLCSCNIKNAHETSVIPTEVSPDVIPLYTPGNITENLMQTTPTPSQSQYPIQTPTPTLVPIPDRDSDSIRIALRVTMRLTEEESAEINRILKEEGLSCEVEFIPDTYWYNDHDWERWVNDNEDKLDIIHVGVWNNNSHMRSFMKRYLLPLNDYLETAEGKKLKDAFGKVGWENSETEDGLVYAVPVLNEKHDKKVYVAIKNDYLPLLGASDFNYELVKKICDGIDYPYHKISIDSISDKLVLSLSGYSWRYGGIPYDKESEKVLSTSECLERLRATCLQLYQDLNEGIVVDESCFSADGENALVYIYYDEEKEIEGYTSFVVNENKYVLGTSGMYGVLASCSRKELALQVLSFCFSDPRIASILCWKNYGENWTDSWKEKSAKWEERLKESKSEPLDEKSRFIPAFSEEELTALGEYSNDLISISKGYYVEKNGALILNPNFERDLDERDLWSHERQELYKTGTDALNRELEGQYNK